MMKKTIAVFALLLFALFIFGCPQPPNPPGNQTNGTNVTPPGNGTNVTPGNETNNTNVTPPCEENWACTDWEPCTWPTNQARSCFDLNDCGTANTKPQVGRECPYGKNETNNTNVTPPQNRSDRITDSAIDFSFTPFGNLYIYAINVGYGDAYLVKRGNFDMLIDAGGPNAGETVVNFLNYLGVDDVEILVVTNHANEHVGGALEVINRLKVEEIWDNDVEPAQTPLYAEFLRQANEKGIPIKHPEVRDNVSYNGIGISVLNPQKKRYNNIDNPGVDSIVLKVGTGGFCTLFGSDAEEGVQPAIMSTGTSIACKVMTLPAHGSGNAASNQFLFAVSPDVAVISVGPNSKGYPNPTTLESLRIKGISIYRTDTSGTAVIISDGTNGNYTISKYVQQ